MGATSVEREVEDLLRKYSSSSREANHGTLYRFENKATGRATHVLISRSVQGADQRKWRNTLADVRGAVREIFGVSFNEKEKEAMAGESRPPLVGPRPTIPGPSALLTGLAGLKVEAKETKVVLVETESKLELAPHHVLTLLRGVGYVVPDDAKISFTNEGYVRVRWTKTSETTEA